MPKKAKKPKLTRAERRARKKEKLRQLRRDHLGREVYYGALTVKNFEKEWRKLLIKFTLPRMREELEFAWQNFERLIDCKDFTISLLMDEIRDAEEQHMLNFRGHMENMEKLFDILCTRIKELEDDYKSEVDQLQKRCDSELNEINEITNENFNYLKTMLHVLELAKKEQDRMMRVEYYSRIDEAEAKHGLLIQKLKAELEKKYQTMFNDIKQFVQGYKRRIRKKKREYEELKRGDDNIQELIGVQFDKIKNLNETMRLLRQKYTDMKQILYAQLLDIQDERNFFASSVRKLKTQLTKELDEDYNKLAIMTRCTNNVFDHLERVEAKGESLLKLGGVCRKYETQKEKIYPFPSTVAAILEDERKKRMIVEEEEVIPNARKELVWFWQRVGEAFNVHYTLKRERNFLTEENQLFVQAHNEYCDHLLHPPIKNYQKKNYDVKKPK